MHFKFTPYFSKRTALNIVSFIFCFFSFSLSVSAATGASKLNLTINISQSSATIRKSEILHSSNKIQQESEGVSSSPAQVGSLLPSQILNAVNGNVLLEQVLNAVNDSIHLDQLLNVETGSIQPGELLIIARDLYSHELFRQVVTDPGFIRAEIFSSDTGLQQSSDFFVNQSATFDFALNNDPNISFLSIYRSLQDEDENGDALQLVENLILPFDLGSLPPPTEAIAPEVNAVTTIIDNGDSDNRVDIAILGDGYTAGDLDKYAQDVESVMAGYFSVEPFNSYQNFFNVHRVDVISSDSGIDHPEDGMYRDTAFDGTYNCSGVQRLVCVDNAKAFEIVARELDSDAYDIVLVIVNDSEYGGSGGALAVISTHPSAVDLALHEIGHSFGYLADEYENGQCQLSEPSEPNATTVLDSDTVKWSHWIDITTDLPTDTVHDHAPGLYEGSKYCSEGVYRPTNNSLMRSLGRAFDSVNEEILVKRIYDFVEPVDSIYPLEPTVEVSGSQVFSVGLPATAESTIDANWYLNGQLVATGINYNVNAAALAAGENTLSVEIIDNTSKVRLDSEEKLSTVYDWLVTASEITETTQRGDANGDGKFNIQDTISIINRVLDQNAPVNQASDCNSDGKNNIQDVICVINKVLNL